MIQGPAQPASIASRSESPVARSADAAFSAAPPLFLVVANPTGGTWHLVAAIVTAALVIAAIIIFHRWRYRLLRRHAETLERSVHERTFELAARNREFAASIRELEAAQVRALDSERTAASASNSKTKFLANVSHELRTPLNAIIGYAELLEEEARDRGDHDLVPQLGKIRFAARHLLSLINSILDLSKIEAGKMELYIETFDVRAMVDEVVATLKQGIERDGNGFQLTVDGELGSVTTDATKVRQVLYNLLSNANKFTNHGEIELQVGRVNRDHRTEQLRICVRDTGIGMTADQIERIFQPFMQGDITMSRRYGGTGLGLAISRRLARLMGGDLTVVSEPEKGSTFTVVIPVVASQSQDDEGY
jgi:hypothetical protein